MRAYIDYLQTLVEVSLAGMGVRVRDERGAMSTEMAVITAALVAIAVAAGVIFMAKMRSNAQNIPDVVSPPQ